MQCINISYRYPRQNRLRPRFVVHGYYFMWCRLRGGVRVCRGLREARAKAEVEALQFTHCGGDRNTQCDNSTCYQYDTMPECAAILRDANKINGNRIPFCLPRLTNENIKIFFMTLYINFCVIDFFLFVLFCTWYYHTSNLIWNVPRRGSIQIQKLRFCKRTFT